MILALLGALAIGVSLGMLGSGGSILTVPVLVYVVGQDEKTAIAGSLLVVGAIAATSGVRAMLRRQVDWSSVLWFGLPGMAGTWLGAHLGALVSGPVQLLTFVAVMALASALMLRRAPTQPVGGARAPLRIAADGVAVGTLTGFVGVGGGFLIVPALVLLGGLPMQRAVGSSLVVIAMTSGSGFLKHRAELQQLDLHLDWQVLLVFVAVGVVGSLLGGSLGQRLDQAMLRRVFAWLLLVMAVAMGVATTVQLLGSAGASPGSH